MLTSTSLSQDASITLCRTYFAHLALGGEFVEGPGCRTVRQDAAPIVHDVNHLQVEAGAEADAAFRLMEGQLGDRPYRQVYVTPEAPSSIVARLAFEEYQPHSTLQQLLVGRLSGPASKPYEIRRAVDAADWAHLDRLVRALHVETREKNPSLPRTAYGEELTRQIQAVRRSVADEIHFFLAWTGGEPVGFFSSWPGVGGVGMVEDLFTLPSHRDRGIARALIHHCVADARARGAGPVLIGSEPTDTPKHLYAAMGFEPVCLTTGWRKTHDP